MRDALTQIENRRSYELRRQLRVKFEGEDGVDEGGLQKEFFHLFLEACLRPEYFLFRYHPESRLYWFNPLPDDKMNHEAAEDCFAIGKLFGLAIYNSVLIEANFPMALYKILVEKPVDLSDLEELDPSLGIGLRSILEMEEETFKASGLEGTPFEIEVPSLTTSAIRFKLPSRQTSLTWETRHEFVQLYVEAILQRTIELPLQAFIRGFKFTFGKSIIFQFQPSEIQTLLCGSQSYDYDELRSSVVYEGGYTPRSPQARWFWEIFMEEFTEFQRRQFLKFVTGTDRAPVGGLGKLGLKIIKNGPCEDRLPTAHTCFNTLLLNAYSSKDKLRHWLCLAIENSSGFGLR